MASLSPIPARSAMPAMTIPAPMIIAIRGPILASFERFAAKPIDMIIVSRSSTRPANWASFSYQVSACILSRSSPIDLMTFVSSITEAVMANAAIPA